MTSAVIGFLSGRQCEQGEGIYSALRKAPGFAAAERTFLCIPIAKGVPPENEEPAMKYGGALFEIEVPQAVKCKIWVRCWWDSSRQYTELAG